MADDLELEFIDTDSESIYEKIKESIENTIGESLYPGDERDVFANALSYVLIAAFNSVNDACQQKMLRYARGTTLDALGEGRGVMRKMSETASVTLKFSVAQSMASNIVIPSGIRVTGDYEHYFITDDTVIINAGDTSATVDATAEIGGSDYNGLEAGTITTIVDISKIPLVSSVTNVTTSAGGADEEEDDVYRERIREAENAYSTAGTAKAYKYWALTADSTVTDAVVSLEDETVTKDLTVYAQKAFIGGTYIHDKTLKVYKKDGTLCVLDRDYSYNYDDQLLTISLLDPIKTETSLKVSYERTNGGHVRIIPLVEGGGVPSDAVIKKVKDVCSSDDVKPLTDIVDVVKPEEVEYSIELTYYTTFKDANEVITNVEGPGGAIDQYKDWQCSCIGYDINPDELRKRILSPGEGLTGANRVIVTKPEYVELNDTQVAKCTGVKVTHVTQDKF